MYNLCSGIIFDIIIIFLPTLVIALIIYPHYSKLNLEEKKVWIKEWGTKKIPIGLILIAILECVYPFFQFHGITIFYILFFIKIALMFLVYYYWIKMIMPKNDT